MSGVRSVRVRDSVSALATSPDGRHALAASKTSVTLLELDMPGSIKTVTTMAPAKSRNRKKDVTCNDVDWCYARPEVFAAGAVTGAVAVLNVGDEKMTKRAMYTFHTRFVNRVQWNGELLLSGSQDGLVCLWDTRMQGSEACVATFASKTGPVHDLSWEPGTPGDTHLKFVTGTTNNVAAVWDLRRAGAKRPVHAIFAHSDLVLSVHWHPHHAGKIVTGGRDKLIKVWNIDADSKTPEVTIQTASAAAVVRWHPTHAHLVGSCSNTTDLNIHVWDVRSKYVPLATFSGHTDQLTAFKWCSPPGIDHPGVLSASRDASVVCSAYGSAKFPYASLPSTALAFSVNASAQVVSSHAYVDRAIGTPMAVFGPDPPVSLFSPSAVASSLFDDAPVFRPVKREVTLCGGLDGEFDADTFRYLAKNYKLDGSLSMAASCEHNAAAAASQGCDDVATTWRMLALLYGDEESESEEIPGGEGGESNSAAAATAPKASARWHPGPDSDGDDGDNDDYGFKVDMSDEGMMPGARTFLGTESVSHPNSRMISLGSGYILGGLDDEAVRSKAAAQAAAVAAASGRGAGRMAKASLTLPAWDHTQVVHQVLHHYAGIGDVQTCVAIAMVLGSRLQLDKELARQYYFGYIELLQRLKLWLAVTEVVRMVDDEAVSMLNQKDTSVKFSCTSCGDALDVRGWFCAKCAEFKRCVLCQQRVRGAWVWCQGCGHGGHPDHLREWFANSKQCPSGCGHACGLDTKAKRSKRARVPASAGRAATRASDDPSPPAAPLPLGKQVPPSRGGRPVTRPTTWGPRRGARAAAAVAAASAASAESRASSTKSSTESSKKEKSRSLRSRRKKR
ncbi:WD repeat-containing protein 24 [Thecamonas trahens ATCC 50062]|uniref:WD repeat-containing protein 24 n=1 Tax=Thecamonas trahens ATCC 50062 TaxID=461836 RepID=A0A0L0D355_THETB|nr:WD repeat-containing protein 24 [Thecamonas trahens ATCC 50062]KNC46777.1 WD repeat-containing protein 24 [Thecamonas trahens ATCC 50062]|eukprot:XP_013760054.1 WD repeat-containing protein 24 [Thecamonas trahens ATCC 50062]